MSLGTQHDGQRGGTGGGVGEVVATAGRIRGAIETVIEGKPDLLRITLTVLLAEGHLLIEDVPGVGKTMLDE